jgi:hypothetical protein
MSRRWLVTFRAFFDESGTDPQKIRPWLWAVFSGESKSGNVHRMRGTIACAIPYFKHHEGQTLDGAFSRFNRANADKKILALTKTVNQFDLTGICVSVLYRWFAHRLGDLLGNTGAAWGDRATAQPKNVTPFSPTHSTHLWSILTSPQPYFRCLLVETNSSTILAGNRSLPNKSDDASDLSEL